MKIVVLDGYTLNPGDLSWDALEEIGELTVYERTTYDLEQQGIVLERMKGAEVVFTNKTPITRETINQLPNLKYIGVLATGYNIVDVEAAKEQGVIVANIPTYGTAAVAQMTFALLLELCHHVGSHSDQVKKGEWSRNPDWCFWTQPLVELNNKNIGIIGFGRIGQEVGKIAQAFGMNVLAFDQYKNLELECDTLRYVDLDEILEKSDVISLHCPLFESTKGLINKNTIEKMKENVMIVNTSRGPLINEEDLADALNSGRISGAALDVVSVEPIKEDNPLLTAENCIITPHISWAPKESRKRLLDIAISNLEQYLSGNPVNVVNKV